MPPKKKTVAFPVSPPANAAGGNSCLSMRRLLSPAGSRRQPVLPRSLRSARARSTACAPWPQWRSAVCARPTCARLVAKPEPCELDHSRPCPRVSGPADPPIAIHTAVQRPAAPAVHGVVRWRRVDLRDELQRRFGECKSQDTILVQINPVERESSPRSASEILNRLNEVSFNAVLLKELRMMALLRQAADPGNSEGAQWAGMRIHRIASEILTELGASSKLNAEWEFFSLLRDEGRRSAQVFLESHASDLGRRSTLDLDVLLEQI